MFNVAKTMTNDQFRVVVKRKLFISSMLCILGVITLTVTLVAVNVLNVRIEDYMKGLYTGAGSGLIAAGAVLFIKNYLVLKDEGKLRKARIESTDERNIAIQGKAMKAAFIIMLVTLYLIMFIGGLWYPILTKVIAVVVFIFAIAYVISYYAISKRM